jgi:hypothetical protein
MGEVESEAVLRAKYLDYCSAQVADILLRLTADEMFVLAEDAARESGLSGELAWDQIVSLATARVSAKLALPSLRDWIERYRADPSQFEPYLMGLWQDEVEGVPDSG